MSPGKKSKFEIDFDSFDYPEQDSVYERIESIINMLHDDEAIEENNLKHEVKLNWAKDNIKIGSLVKTTCPYMMNIFDNRDNTAKSYVSHWQEPIPAGSQILFLGFELIRVRRNSLGEKIKVPSYEVRHSWMIEDRICYCNIHPMHFDLTQMGTGVTWEEALRRKLEKSGKILDQRHKGEPLPYKGSPKPYVLVGPDYDKLVNFWAGAKLGNPVRVDAFIAK